MVQQRRRSKKWIYWLILLVLLAVAGIVIWRVWDTYFKDKNSEVDNTVEVTDVVEVEEESNYNDNGNVETVSEGVEKKKVVQYEGEDPNEAEELSGVITYAGVNDGKLMIRVNIDQYLADGQCELTLARGGANIYSSIANIVGSATTSTCEGFDVGVSELGSGGLEINIKISADGREGTIRGEASI